MIFDDKHVAIAKEIFQEKKDLESAIATLKEEGANQMQTTQAMCRALKMKLAEVDSIVLNSPSWSNERDFNLDLRDRFLDESE